MIRATTMHAFATTLAAAALVCACGSSDEERRDKQKECDAIAEDIRNAARVRGIASQGICNNPSATDFAAACARLRKCNQELDEL